jgi:hypothetical protein
VRRELPEDDVSAEGEPERGREGRPAEIHPLPFPAEGAPLGVEEASLEDERLLLAALERDAPRVRAAAAKTGGAGAIRAVVRREGGIRHSRRS